MFMFLILEVTLESGLGSVDEHTILLLTKRLHPVENTKYIVMRNVIKSVNIRVNMDLQLQSVNLNPNFQN